jgi:hypothetical protein
MLQICWIFFLRAETVRSKRGLLGLARKAYLRREKATLQDHKDRWLIYIAYGRNHHQIQAGCVAALEMFNGKLARVVSERNCEMAVIEKKRR